VSEERPDGPEDVGSVGDEAAKLLGALTDWARDHGAGLGHDLSDHLATGAPECTYCPICRTVHAVRQASPEVRTHLAVAAASLMQAAAGILAAASAEEPHPRPGPVEHIDLDEEDDA
jgi:hypothetical protein